MISIVNENTDKVIPLQLDRMIIIEGGTWDDYWALSHEDIKVEFIDEEIFIHSPASLEHEEIFGELLTKIRTQINEGKIIGSRFPIRLSDGKRAEPDILYLSPKAIREGNLTKTLFEGSPTFIIEIVSPNYREHDTQTKREKYRKLGVSEYWIIDPELKELRVYLFEDKKIKEEFMYTEDIVNPKNEYLKHIDINLSKLWETTIEGKE